MKIIKIDEEIGYWGISSYSIKKQLEETTGDIQVEINSPGGSVFEGISIFNAFKSYDKGQVHMVITGLAASMASYIPLAGDTIKAYDNATYMIHNARMFLSGDFNHLRKNADTLEGLSNIVKKAYLNKTGKSDKDLTKLMDEESYFFGDDILNNGFVDEIITTVEEKDSKTALALANESFKSCMNNARMKDEKEELITAVIDECKGQCPQTVGTNPSKKEKIENSKQENSMEYTKENFEALEKANEKALKDGNSEATATERKRVTGIIALGGNSEFTAKQIEDGATAGDSAIALLISQKTEMQTKKDNFAADADNLNNVTDDNTEDTLTDEQKAEAQADAALENIGGK